jgi:hypothetical protein
MAMGGGRGMRRRRGRGRRRRRRRRRGGRGNKTQAAVVQTTATARTVFNPRGEGLAASPRIPPSQDGHRHRK